MKYALVLFLTMFNTVAYAASVYRCDDGAGQVVYQDRDCGEAPVEAETNPDQPAEPLAAAAPLAIKLDADRDYQQRRQWRRRAKREAPAEALRLQLLLKPSDDLRQAEYAENHNRCQNAVRVAELCGSPAGFFSCDARGFSPNSIMPVGTPKRGEIDNGALFKIEQCALQAEKGRS